MEQIDECCDLSIVRQHTTTLSHSGLQIKSLLFLACDLDRIFDVINIADGSRHVRL
jgi:hypothetical protein